MTKLTLKKPLSIETQERLMKLKGGSDGTEKQNNNKKPQTLFQADKATIEPQEKLTQENRDRAKAKERFHETKAWLESTYPKALNFNEPKPLKPGIERDLLDSSSPYSKSQLRKCLRVYCASRGYLRAIVQGNWRYDLNGEKVGEIIQEHKDHALKQLEYNRGAVK
jgi:ProP effector